MHFNNLESLVNLCIGAGLVTIPIQIFKLYQQKTAREMPLINWLIGSASNLIMALYFWQIQKYTFACLYSVNLFLCLIVVGQIIYYQNFCRNPKA